MSFNKTKNVNDKWVPNFFFYALMSCWKVFLRSYVYSLVYLMLIHFGWQFSSDRRQPPTCYLWCDQVSCVQTAEQWQTVINHGDTHCRVNIREKISSQMFLVTKILAIFCPRHRLHFGRGNLQLSAKLFRESEHFDIHIWCKKTLV